MTATRIAQADYRMEELAREMNLAAARLAKAACAKYSTPERPRYAAGAFGPAAGGSGARSSAGAGAGPRVTRVGGGVSRR